MGDAEHSVAVLAVAMVIDGMVGYPGPVSRLVGHPVMALGALVAALDARLNRPEWSDGARRLAGAAAVVVLLAVVGGVALALTLACRSVSWGWLPEAALASTLLALTSLREHVAAVAAGLRLGLAEGRRAVAMIVGRDPEALDEAGVARAAMESLAENFSDGVIAPAFWLLAGGLPGLALYKAINTADSMIGHRTPRHQAFGWAAARLDDLVNLPGARLSALLIAAAAAFSPDASASVALSSAWRDARHHRSPNAGWPEAALAGALGLRLAGPRVYGAVPVDDAWMGRGRAAATPDDIDHALAIIHRAGLLAMALAAAGWAALSG